mmetsp:Transcript_38077/g.58106  ORF Transcript_38077/g.58106 Transcript_38077/m.58106 type:complete len:80 (+) Transcript_38077:608-847(+)
MSKRLLRIILFAGVVYSVINYIGTTLRGRPLYDFLDWQDWKSPVVIVALLSGISGIYMVMCKIDKAMKSSRFETGKKLK